MITPPPAQLLYSRTIEVLGAIKEIQLFWGDISTIVNSDTSVLISSNVHNEKREFTDKGIAAQPIGQAWASLQSRFALDGHGFRPVLEATQGSSVWATSDVMERTLERGGADFRRLIRIDCLKPSKENVAAPPNIFCIHTLPFRQSTRNPETALEDYTYTLAALLASVRAQEAADCIAAQKNEPYKEIAMSALAAQQFDQPHVLLRHLMEAVSEWFIVSPKLRTIKICYWDKEIHRKLLRRSMAEGLENEKMDVEGQLRRNLLEEIGEEVLQKEELQVASTRLLLEEFKLQLGQFLENELVRKEGELITAIENMLTVLDRENPTTLEIGSSSGRLSEGLVNHLYFCFYGKRPSTFHGGIEDLATKPPTSENYRGLKISAWYKSYLHTIRILRNTSVHSQDESETQFPQKLVNEDTWVLLVNLRRVIAFHIEILLKQVK